MKKVDGGQLGRGREVEWGFVARGRGRSGQGKDEKQREREEKRNKRGKVSDQGR